MNDFADLETVLDEIHAALLAGNLARLGDLAARADVETGIDLARDIPSEIVKRIRAKAQRNERLLVAATRGVKAARQRARELAEAGRFSTYDAGGRRDTFGVAAQTPARRF